MIPAPLFPACRLTLLLALATLLAAGCGRPTRASVSGTVTYKNQPVGVGRVTFHFDKNQSPSAELKPDGSYTLTDVPVGEAKVTVEAVDFSRMAGATAAPKGTPVIPDSSPKGKFVRVPDKYKSPASSQLSFPVKGGSQQIDIPLQ